MSWSGSSRFRRKDHVHLARYVRPGEELQSDYAANGVHHPDINPTGEVLDPGYLYEVKNIPDFNKTSDTRVELVGVIKI